LFLNHRWFRLRLVDHEDSGRRRDRLGFDVLDHWRFFDHRGGRRRLGRCRWAHRHRGLGWGGWGDRTRASSDDGFAESFFHQTLLALPLYGSSNPFGFGAVQIGHMVGHLDTKTAELGDHILRGHSKFFGQLINADLGR
jgi:hypothetical protein